MMINTISLAKFRITMVTDLWKYLRKIYIMLIEVERLILNMGYTIPWAVVPE